MSLASGTYVFKDGPLLVKDGGSLTGINTSLYFSGSTASLNFAPTTTISLTAPKGGDMAGILIAEDRKNPVGNSFEIYSNNARNLLARSICHRAGCMCRQQSSQRSVRLHDHRCSPLHALGRPDDGAEHQLRCDGYPGAPGRRTEHLDATYPVSSMR